MKAIRCKRMFVINFVSLSDADLPARSPNSNSLEDAGYVISSEGSSGLSGDDIVTLKLSIVLSATPALKEPYQMKAIR